MASRAGSIGRRIGAFRAMIVIICLIDVVGLVWTGWRTQSFGRVLLGSLGLGLVEAFYIRLRPRPQIASLAGAAADLVAFSAAAAVLSYLAVALGFPLVDNTLAALDDRLGLDWLGYYHWYKAQPLPIKLVMMLSYFSDIMQILVLIVVFNFMGRSHGAADRCRLLIWGYALTVLAAIGISGILPAAGEFVRHGVELDTGYIPQFQSAYDCTMTVIDLKTVQGIITFPSFHAALSVVIVFSAYGIWPLFGPLLVVNVIDILSTPVMGGHYFADVFAGVGIALFCILVLKCRPKFFGLDGAPLCFGAAAE